MLRKWYADVFIVSLVCAWTSTGLSAQDAKKAGDKEPKDAWKEGSVWKGTGTNRSEKGMASWDAELTIVKRKGDHYEAELKMENGKTVLSLEGDVGVTGVVKFEVVAVPKTDDNKKVTFAFVWRNFPKPGSIMKGDIKLKLSEDD
jgi:hypothetical protein